MEGHNNSSKNGESDNTGENQDSSSSNTELFSGRSSSKLIRFTFSRDCDFLLCGELSGVLSGVRGDKLVGDKGVMDGVRPGEG